MNKEIKMSENQSDRLFNILGDMQKDLTEIKVSVAVTKNNGNNNKDSIKNLKALFLLSLAGLIGAISFITINFILPLLHNHKL